MATIAYRWDDPDRQVATWDALHDIGFLPVDDNWGCPSISYDFGSFKLQATLTMGRYFQEVVSFSGVYRTPRRIGSIEFDMPLRVESREQCAAWIAWHLNENLPRREQIIPESRSDLLVFGLKHEATLPWRRQMAAYQARPQCSVERGWLRQALKSIKANVSDADPDSKISISFDGRVLIFQSAKWIAPLPAQGEPWPDKYEIAVSDFYFPSRLMQETIHVSIWDGNLLLGNRLFRRVTIAEAIVITTNTSDSSES